jgi:dihydrofolate synthase/folylpolyglutamate synthase
MTADSPDQRRPRTSLRTLEEWLARIEVSHPRAMELGLDRVGSVRDAMGLIPPFPVITVGGTNGKGSTCAFLEAMLLHAGYRVGCYTSPHIRRYHERVRIGGVPADDATLIEGFESVEAHRREVRLTYFEYGTLAAVHAFRHAAVDVAVLEVGLGGRLDAVNVFDTDCAVLTSIALDHMEWLGNTRELIGAEKAGIFRGGRPAICADPDTPSSVRDAARAVGARYLEIGRDFEASGDDRQWQYRGPGGLRAGLPVPAMRGAYQIGNAAAAITAIDAVRDRLPVGTQDIRAGLVSAVVPGRFQVLPGRPFTILDVAHNPHAASALAGTLAAMPRARRTFGVFGMLRDKDVAGVVAAVKSEIDVWCIAGLDGPRGADARALAAQVAAIAPWTSLECHADVASAWRAAVEVAGDDDRICVFGSFHTVAAALDAIDRRRSPGS